MTYEPFPEVLCDAGPRTLSIGQLFTTGVDKVRGGYKVRTLQYDYSLNGPDENGIWIEIVSYHGIPMKAKYANLICMWLAFRESAFQQVEYQSSVSFVC